MIYLFWVYQNWFFFNHLLNFSKYLLNPCIILISRNDQTGVVFDASKKGNSNRFLPHMDGRFRQQLTIIDVSMSVARLIISTYFEETLFLQRWCLQVFGLCDRITWKQINWKTKKWLVVDTRLKCCQLIFLQCFFFVWNITIGYLWAS